MAARGVGLAQVPLGNAVKAEQQMIVSLRQVRFGPVRERLNVAWMVVIGRRRSATPRRGPFF